MVSLFLLDNATYKQDILGKSIYLTQGQHAKLRN